MTTLTPKQWIELVHRAGSAEAAALVAALADYARAGAVTVTARVLSVVTGLSALKIRRLIRRLPGVNVARVGRAGWSFSIEDAVWPEARSAGNSPAEMRTQPDAPFPSEMRTPIFDAKSPETVPAQNVGAENAEKRDASFSSEMRTAFSSRKRMEPFELEGVAASNAEKRDVSFSSEMRTPLGAPFPSEMRTPIFDAKPPEIIPAQEVGRGITSKTGVSFSGPNGGNFQPAGGASNAVKSQYVENQRVLAESETAASPPDPPSGLLCNHSLRSVSVSVSVTHARARARGQAGDTVQGTPPPVHGQEPAGGAVTAAAGSGGRADSDAAASIWRSGRVFNATPGPDPGTAPKTPVNANASERYALGREVGPGKPGAKAVGPSGAGSGGGAPPPGVARAEGRGSGAGPAAGGADGAAQKRPRGKPSDTAAARELVARFALLFKRHWNRSYAARAADVTHARNLVRLGVRPGHLEEVLPQVWRYGGYAARASLTVRGVALHWNELQVAAARYKPAARDLTRVTPAVRKMLKDDPEELKRQIAEYGETEEDDDPWT